MSTTSFCAPERDGQRGRGRVGVDVEHLAVTVQVRRDRRDHRDAARREQVEHRLRPDLDDLADQPEVDVLAVDDTRAGGAR